MIPSEPSRRGPGPHRADERARVERYICTHPRWADAWIAEQIGVTRATVRRARIRLAGRGELSLPEWVVCRDGSRHPWKQRTTPRCTAP